MKKILRYIVIVIVLIIIVSSLTYFMLKNNKNIEKIHDSFVYIESINSTSTTSGSGFLYKKEKGKDYILTNYHVISDSDLIYVYNMKKQKILAQVLNYDIYSDIAILVAEDKLNLKEADIGNSDNLKIGDTIYVVGTPISIDYIGTITHGIISFINREISVSTHYGNSYYEAIQLDAKISFGNSGGPVLDENGKVIGMIAVKEEALDNVGFAIPVNYLFEQAEKLENNKFIRPTLGVVVTNATNSSLLEEKNINIDQELGVVLINVEEGYPFYHAGLMVGDVIVKINDNDISNVKEFQKLLYSENIGNSVVIEYYRDGKYFSAKVMLDK